MILHRQTEDAPSSWPQIGGANADAAWQRVEQWIAWRWAKRDVTWTVEGGGLFRPPLAPWDCTTCKVWGGSWEIEDDCEITPLGILLPDGLHQIKAEVGSDDTVPAAVTEAVTRLHAYMKDLEAVGARSYSETLGQMAMSVSRSETAAARALELSGAADLLRPWRYA